MCSVALNAKRSKKCVNICLFDLLSEVSESVAPRFSGGHAISPSLWVQASQWWTSERQNLQLHISYILRMWVAAAGIFRWKWDSVRHSGTRISQKKTSTAATTTTTTTITTTFHYNYKCKCNYTVTTAIQLQLHLLQPLQLQLQLQLHFNYTTATTTTTITITALQLQQHLLHYKCKEKYITTTTTTRTIITLRFAAPLHAAFVGEVTTATTRKITTTFRSINGFALPSMHHKNSLLL